MSDHIDTMVLRALIDDKDDPDLKRGARKLLERQDKPLEVCHLTIGEAFAKMAENRERSVDDCAEAMRGFCRLIGTKSIRICGFHNPTKTHELALRLHNDEPTLEPNDGIILANALLCSDCDSFHTVDSTILYSKAIRLICSEHKMKIVKLPVLDTCRNRRKTY